MGEPPSAPGGQPRICVFAPTSILMVEIEHSQHATGSQEGTAEIHVHRGGQGLWVTSMVAALAARASVVGPFGGETGAILRQLADAEGVQVNAVGYSAGNPALVHDRRGGQRREIATMPARPLTRHETDELYGAALVTAMESDLCILTGDQPAGVLPASVFGRLVHDLRTGGIPVVADLSGAAATEAAAKGPRVLKMSHEEVVRDGLAPDGAPASLRRAGQALVDQGVGTMLITRADDSTLVIDRDGAWQVISPALTAIDHRGAGDSMTAGLAVALARGRPVLEAVRLGAAAGTLNVTRRGLGTGRREEIERFTAQIRVEAWE